MRYSPSYKVCSVIPVSDHKEPFFALRLNIVHLPIFIRQMGEETVKLIIGVSSSSCFVGI